MSNENNKMQVDIENLFKQNVNDLSSIKELYRKLKEIEDRITQIKYIDTTLTKKLQKDYEKLKKQITDENFQLQINSKIDNVKAELKATLNAEINEVDLQLSKKANLDDLGQPSQEQVNNWLNSNPQATTTVVDNSITDRKINNKSELYKISEVIKENCIDNETSNAEYLIGSRDEGATSGVYGVHGFCIPFICNDEIKEYDSFIIKNIEVDNTEDIVLTFAIRKYATEKYDNDLGEDLYTLNKTINLSGETSIIIDLENNTWSKLDNSSVYMFVVYAKSKDGSSFIQLNQHYTTIENKTDNIFNVNFNNYSSQGLQKRVIGSTEYVLQMKYMDNAAPFVGFIKKGESNYNYNKIFINKKSEPLKGKKIAFLGDSLTWGFNGAVAWEQVEKPISVLVAELTGATCINYGISGSTLSGDGSTTDKTDGHILGINPMNLRIKNIDNVDAIFCMGGTNDFATDRKVPVGRMEDTNNLTFYGGLDTIIKHIGNEKPRIKLIMGTPPRRAEERANMYGNTLSDYVNAVKEKCEYYGINYVDLYNKGNCLYWSSKWREIYSPDGLHGTQELYNNYAILIANELIKIL